MSHFLEIVPSSDTTTFYPKHAYLGENLCQISFLGMNHSGRL